MPLAEHLVEESLRYSRTQRTRVLGFGTTRNLSGPGTRFAAVPGMNKFLLVASLSAMGAACGGRVDLPPGGDPSAAPPSGVASIPDGGDTASTSSDASDGGYRGGGGSSSGGGGGHVACTLGAPRAIGSIDELKGFLNGRWRVCRGRFPTPDDPADALGIAFQGDDATFLVSSGAGLVAGGGSDYQRFLAWESYANVAFTLCLESHGKGQCLPLSFSDAPRHLRMQASGTNIDLEPAP